MSNYQTYNQGNQAWGNKVMSPGSLTLAKAGCLVTALSSGISNFTYNLDPGQLCDKLVTGGAFMPSSDLSWSAFERCFPQLAVAERDSTTALKINHDANPVEIETALDRCKRLAGYGQVVVLNVDHLWDDGIADHWVLLVDDKWNIMDPDGGLVIPFSERYGDPRTGIKGFAFVVGTPGWFLDGTSKEEADRWVAIGETVLLMRKYPNDPVVKRLFDGLTR